MSLGRYRFGSLLQKEKKAIGVNNIVHGREQGRNGPKDKAVEEQSVTCNR